MIKLFGSPVTRTRPSQPVERSATHQMMDTPTTPMPVVSTPQRARDRWLQALKQVLPLYIAVHVAIFITTVFSIFFIHKDFYTANPPLSTLWQAWDRWDTGWYMTVTLHGYGTLRRTAFFPLYPLLIRGTMFLIQNPFIAGLVVSNIADLVMLVVLYRLIAEDFDTEHALRGILYLSLFPTAFFLLAAYNESIFICLTLLSFYQMRRGHWWLAGLFGFLATLTRPVGLLLVLPFCYEYLRQHDFQMKKLRFDLLALGLVPGGIALFSFYCYKLFGKPLAFTEAEALWSRHFELPWYGIINAIRAIATSQGPLSFLSLRNLIDLVPDLFILALLLLGIFGPWRFKRSYWSYLVYGIALYIFLQLNPVISLPPHLPYPLQSVSRYMLEVFPAFILLTILGKHRVFHIAYILLAAAGFFPLMLLFLIGHWII